LYIVKVETEAKRQPKLNELGFKNIYELTLWNGDEGLNNKRINY
jgi:hypothetical protein